jgi:hypothetical protein
MKGDEQQDLETGQQDFPLTQKRSSGRRMTSWIRGPLGSVFFSGSGLLYLRYDRSFTILKPKKVYPSIRRDA